MRFIHEITQLRRASNRQKLQTLVYLAIIVTGIYIILWRGVALAFNPKGPDYFHYYVSGYMWNRGTNPYDYDAFRKLILEIGGLAAYNQQNLGFLYPPNIHVISSIIAIFPVETSYLLFTLGTLICYTVGLGLLAFLLSSYRSIGLQEVAFLVLLLSSIIVRTTLFAGQITGFLFLGTVLCLVLVYYDKDILAGVVLSVIAIKPQSIIVLLIFFLLLGRYKLVAASIIMVALFWLVPLIFMQQSPVTNLSDWLKMISTASGDVNSTSPFSETSLYLTQPEVLVNRIFNQQSTLTSLISISFGLSLCFVAAYPIIRSKPNRKLLLLDIGMAAMLGNMLFYNRWHGMHVVFIGMIAIYMHFLELPPSRARWLWGAWFLVVLIILSLPQGQIYSFFLNNSNFRDSRIVQILLPYLTWLGAAFTISLIILRWSYYRKEQEVTLTELEPYPLQASL